MAPGSEQLGQCIGLRVVGVDGRRVGRVAEIHADPRTGRPEWAVVYSGRFGHSSTLVPLAGASLGAAALWVPYPAEFIDSAPRVAITTWLSDKQKRGLARYYQTADPQSSVANPR